MRGVRDDLGCARGLGQPLPAIHGAHRRRVDEGLGPERVHADPLTAQFLGESKRRQAHPVFGHRVRQVLSGPLRIEVQWRRQREDMRVRRTAQGRKGEFAEHERPPDVDIGHQVVAFHLHRVCAGQVDRRSIVDHDVDPAEGLHGGGDRASDVVLVPHVPDDWEGAPACRFDLARRGVHGTLEARVRVAGLCQQGDIGAIARGPQCDGQPDSAAPPGDQQGAALKPRRFGACWSAMDICRMIYGMVTCSGVAVGGCHGPTLG